MNPEASAMIPYAYSYLGTPYSTMDCQAFIERCLKDIGVNVNLSGSNAWYRRMNWTGSPEECKKTFGQIPPGAFLFILEPVNGKTPERYCHDGIGDASHIGLYTGQGKGAVASSRKAGCVIESPFYGRTINGGWNRVGLWTERLSYSGTDGEGAGKIKQATVVADGGNYVKMRQEPSNSCNLYWEVPIGATVDVYRENGSGWANIQYGGRTGWMKTQYLSYNEDGETEPAHDDTVTVTLPKETCEQLLQALSAALGV